LGRRLISHRPTSAQLPTSIYSRRRNPQEPSPLPGRCCLLPPPSDPAAAASLRYVAGVPQSRCGLPPPSLTCRLTWRRPPTPPPLAPHLVARSSDDARRGGGGSGHCVPRRLDSGSVRASTTWQWWRARPRPGSSGLPPSLAVSICMRGGGVVHRRPTAPSPAPVAADLGCGRLRRCVCVCARAHGGGGVWRRRPGGGVRRRLGGGGRGGPLRLFFQKLHSLRAIVISWRTSTERVTHGSRRRGLRWLGSAERPSPRASSR
jgi:hypothetical protein